MSLSILQRSLVVASPRSIMMAGAAQRLSKSNLTKHAASASPFLNLLERDSTAESRHLAIRQFTSPAHTSWAPAKPVSSLKPLKEETIADHSWRQCNRIWSDEEVKEKMKSKNMKHVPVTTSDKIMRGAMRSMYHTFNFITGYEHINPSPKSIEWRLIILESFAGVPGMLAAGFRHFYSLRTLRRDHGSIFTFLEEAENERMHLLVCLKMFQAKPITKGLVVVAQLSMTPILMLTYMIHPQAMHRFVGYLEETAVETYSNIVEHCETPGTKLHEAWAHLPAPAIAKTYWSLKEDASWVTCLKHMLADEAHHRDVNHTFATLPEGADNPFITEHMDNFDRAALKRTDAILKNAMKQQGISSSVENNPKRFA